MTKKKPTSAPPKKRKPTTITAKVIVPDPMVAVRKGRSATAGRLEAGLKYLTSTDGLSLEELARDPAMIAAGVSLSQLKSWALRDSWGPQRNRLFGRVFARVRLDLEKVLEVRVKERVLKLHEMEAYVWRNFKKGVENKSLESKSLIDVVKAYAILLDLMDKAESKVTGTVDLLGKRLEVGDAKKPKGESEAMLALAPADVREVSRRLMEERRAKISIVPPPPPKAAPGS